MHTPLHHRVVRHRLCSKTLLIVASVDMPWWVCVVAQVGVHGAQLTHVMWMREGSALLEIHMRYGFCCAEQPDFTHHRAGSAPDDRTDDPPDPRHACGACDGYAKPDYANMAHTFGVRYAYLDAAFVSPPRNYNNVDRAAVHVDTNELMRAALLLLQSGRGYS